MWSVYKACVFVHTRKWTPVLEYDLADNFSSALITKRRENDGGNHVSLYLAEICFSVYKYIVL